MLEIFLLGFMAVAGAIAGIGITCGIGGIGKPLPVSWHGALSDFIRGLWRLAIFCGLCYGVGYLIVMEGR